MNEQVRASDNTVERSRRREGWKPAEGFARSGAVCRLSALDRFEFRVCSGHFETCDPHFSIADFRRISSVCSTRHSVLAQL
eukprot:695591-Hanusia_phi.AAC.1